MNEGKGNGRIIEKLKRLKRIKALLAIISPFAGGVILVLIVLLCVYIVNNVNLPMNTTASSSGMHTVYDDTYVMENINKDLENWSDEEKFAFNEMKRQRQIWVNDYPDYKVNNNVVKNYESNELDLIRYIVPIHFRGVVNLDSYGKDFYDDEANNGIYNGENIVDDAATKDFFKQAGEKLGSTFFLFPGLRQMIGNSISADINYNAIHPEYAACGDGSGYYCLQNLNSILSDWQAIGNMYMNGESELNYYYSNYPNLGPATAANYLASAINYGYENCLVNVPEDKNDWNYQNICNDYKLIFKENNKLVDYNGDSASGTYYSKDLIEQALNRSLAGTLGGSYAQIPVYEYAQNGSVTNSNIKLKISSGQVAAESSRYFISVRVQRDKSDDAYDKYLTDIYIPVLFINCENCNKNNSADSILNSMKNFEKIFHYYNGYEYNITPSGNYETAGAKHVTESAGGYTCNGATIGISADYVGHKANDLYSSITPTIFPLMEGKVVAVNNTCHSLCPSSDANAYVFRTKTLSQLSAACQCGGGWGNYVKIESQYNGKTIYAIYAHLSEVAVSVGQEITFETPLGIMGTTGVSTGKHLHIELNYTSTSSNKFPPTKIFSTKSVLSTICGGNGKRDDDTNEENV